MVANGRPVLVTFIALELSPRELPAFLHLCVAESRLPPSLLNPFWICFCFYASFSILLCIFYISSGGAAVFCALMATRESQAIDTSWQTAPLSSSWLNTWKMWLNWYIPACSGSRLKDEFSFGDYWEVLLY